MVVLLITACGTPPEPLSDAHKTWCLTPDAAFPLEAAFNALESELDAEFVTQFVTATQNGMRDAVDSGQDPRAAFVQGASFAGRFTNVQIGGVEINEYGEREYPRLCRAAWDATHN